jgi:hypothetical protein
MNGSPIVKETLSADVPAMAEMHLPAPSLMIISFLSLVKMTRPSLMANHGALASQGTADLPSALVPVKIVGGLRWEFVAAAVTFRR